MDSGPIDPTVVCAWCDIVLREGGVERSHGICRSCAAHFLEKLHVMRVETDAVPPAEPVAAAR